MKRYNIDCHYDVVVTVEVTAESEDQAREAARNISTPQGYLYPGDHKRALYSRSEKVGYTQNITAKEAARRKREAVMEYVRDVVNDSSLEKWELAQLAFEYEGGEPWCLSWDFDHAENEPWLDTFGKAIYQGTDPKAALYDRYARWAARLAFRRRFPTYAVSDYTARHLDTLSRQQQKAEIHRFLDRLDDMTESYIDDDDETVTDEPNAFLRFTNRDDSDIYWNLFVRCTGPNDSEDENDPFSYCICWQRVNDRTGDIEDFDGCEIRDRKQLIRELFYIENPANMAEGLEWDEVQLSGAWID